MSSAVGDAAAGQFLTYIKERCFVMYSENIIDVMAIKLERVHVLADALLMFVEDNPQAQVIASIILETSVLPKT